MTPASTFTAVESGMIGVSGDSCPVSVESRSRRPVLTPKAKLARLIDHTLVRAYATQTDIDELCTEAVACGFAGVCINTAWTSYCAKRLAGSGVKVIATVGFPLGATTAQLKVEETKEAVRHGAEELDAVINIGAIKSGFPSYVEKEIAAIVKAAGQTPVKIILEAGYLNEREKIEVCEMAVRQGAAFVKTSTGFGGTGATAADVRLMRRVVGQELGVKASGGIRSYRDAMVMLEAGANRLGTSSGIEILRGMPKD